MFTFLSKSLRRYWLFPPSEDSMCAGDVFRPRDNFWRTSSRMSFALLRLPSALVIDRFGSASESDLQESRRSESALKVNLRDSFFSRETSSDSRRLRWRRYLVNDVELKSLESRSLFQTDSGFKGLVLDEALSETSGTSSESILGRRCWDRCFNTSFKTSSDATWCANRSLELISESSSWSNIEKRRLISADKGCSGSTGGLQTDVMSLAEQLNRHGLPAIVGDKSRSPPMALAIDNIRLSMGSLRDRTRGLCAATQRTQSIYNRLLNAQSANHTRKT